MWSCLWRGCWLIPSSASRFLVSVWRWGAQSLDNLLPKLGGLASVGTLGSFSQQHSLCGHPSKEKINDPKRRESRELGFGECLALFCRVCYHCHCPCSTCLPAAPTEMSAHQNCPAVISTFTWSIMRTFSHRKLTSPSYWEVKVIFWGGLWSQSALIQIPLTSHVTLGESFKPLALLVSSQVKWRW